MENTEMNYSEDGETFYPGFGELLDRLDSTGELEVGRQYESCEARPVTAEDVGVKSLVEDLIESIDERMWDLRCLAEDERPSDGIANEAGAELESLLSAWVEKHILAEKRYQMLINGTIKVLQITEQDVIDYYGTDTADGQ